MGSHHFYRTKTAMSMSMKSATLSRENFVSRQGAIFIEFANATGTDEGGNTTYGWADRQVIALGIADITLLLGDVHTNGIVHQKDTPDGKSITKAFSISELPPKDNQKAPVYWAGLRVTANGEAPLKFGIAMSPGDLRVFMELLKQSIPDILGWRV